MDKQNIVYPYNGKLFISEKKQTTDTCNITDKYLKKCYVKEASYRRLRLEKSPFLFFFLFRAAPVAHGGSQARGQTRATAAGLHHNHSNVGSKLHLQPTPQLMATPDP